MEEEDRGNGSRVSRRVLGVALVVVVALGAIGAVAIPRLQTPRVSPPPPPTTCIGSSCSPPPPTCTGSTCTPPPPTTKSPSSLKQISIFSVLGNGTGLNARFGLAAESGEPLGSDGNITFSLADSQTGETAYRESFAVKSSQFAPDYAWFVPFSQVGKVIYRSTGNATLGFTAPDAKIFSATFNRIALPSLSGQETIQWFDSRFLQSATTVEQSQTKGYFNVTLVKIGNWTHPKYLFWGPLVTVFRVDLTVTNIATQTENLWPSYFYLVDNLSGNHTGPVGTSTLPLALEDILPGETREGYLLFPVLNPNASEVTIVITYTGSPIIVYQFPVDI